MELFYVPVQLSSSAVKPPAHKHSGVPLSFRHTLFSEHGGSQIGFSITNRGKERKLVKNNNLKSCKKKDEITIMGLQKEILSPQKGSKGDPPNTDSLLI